MGATAMSRTPPPTPPPRSRNFAPASSDVHLRTLGKSPTTPRGPSGVRRWVMNSETWNGSSGEAEYGSAVTRKDSVAMGSGLREGSTVLGPGGRGPVRQDAHHLFERRVSVGPREPPLAGDRHRRGEEQHFDLDHQ